MDERAFELVQNLCGAHFVARALHVVAESGVADAVDEEPASIAALAAATGSDEDALGRVLRLLASYGVFELTGTSVRHTPASQLLRTGHPASLRAFVRMFGLPVMWRSAEGLFHSVRTGEAAAPLMFPDGGFWGELAAHPEHARIFDAAMVSKARGQIGAILAAYDFSQFESLADIGGGHGHLLRAAVAAQPGLRGVLFDLPHVIDAAKSAGDRQDRMTFVAGDFFNADLPACDGYLLMEVLHDWADAPARQILGAVRKVASGHAKLLVIETVVPEDAGPDWSKTLDIVMLALFAARQRTTAQYRELLRSSGFELMREIDTGAGISIFEAQPV